MNCILGNYHVFIVGGSTRERKLVMEAHGNVLKRSYVFDIQLFVSMFASLDIKT